MKTEEEVVELRDNINEHDDSKFHNMTYEQGIADALDWVQDDTGEMNEFADDYLNP